MAQSAVILLTEEELDKRVDERVEKKIEALKRLFDHTPKEEVYDSRDQTRLRLGVSLPTLDEMVKRGDIPAYRVGIRVLFKRSEVDAAIPKINSDKFYNRQSQG